MAMEYFCCYHSYRSKTAKLSDQELGRLFRSLMQYSETGERPEIEGRESIAFDFIADDIDRTKANYIARCETNRRNRTGTIDNDRQQSSTAVDETNQNKNKNENKNENKNNKGERSAPARFNIPTMEEVKRYCEERHNGIVAEHFIDYYTANGWKIGKNPMKDWKAAVRSWEKNGYNDQKATTDNRSKLRHRTGVTESKNHGAGFIKEPTCAEKSSSMI